MIVNSNLISAIGVGSDAASPEMDDARLHIPATLVPALLFTTPMTVNLAQPPPINTSFAESIENVHTNAAAASTDLVILARGLWEITLNVSAWFNYNSAGAGADFVSWRLQTESNLVLANIVSFAAQTGLFMFSTSFRALLNANTIINRRMPTNAVGQTIQASTSIIANKIL